MNNGVRLKRENHNVKTLVASLLGLHIKLHEDGINLESYPTLFSVLQFDQWYKIYQIIFLLHTVLGAEAFFIDNVRGSGYLEEFSISKSVIYSSS